MKIKNIAVIPARKNSKGIKFKNRTFFHLTADFAKSLNFVDNIIVTSDDPKIIKKAKNYNFEIHKRKKIYATDKTSIKKTLKNLIKEKKLNKNDILWLFYIPLVNREKKKILIEHTKSQKKNFKAYVLL